MKIATWNVNSLRVREEQVLAWLEAHPADLLCLQETKVTDDKFPAMAFTEAGYRVAYAGQKTYNGVAILSREKMEDRLTVLPGIEDPQKRFQAVTVNGIRVINAYVPNGAEVGSEKYRYKLDWLAAFETFLAGELARHDDLVTVGDFNIAPEDRDVHDPAAWEGKVLVSPAERAAFQRLLDLPLTDCFRRLEPGGDHFTWWDYRAGGFRRNRGVRIDHILASDALAARLVSCDVDKEPRRHERPSDHAPVMATFKERA